MKKLYLLIMALVVTSLSFGQISGTFTIPGATYTTIASAIAALNTSGVGAGGVTFNVTAGYTETFASPTAGYLTIPTNPPTLANQVIFQKSGSGADPKITAGIGTGTMDAIIAFSGVNYITFNGIDVYESAGNTTTTTQMEWGYAVLKNSGTQGSQNITIKNCTISLNITNTATYGIYLNNHTTASTTQLTVTSATGQNSNNKFYGNTITNCYNGIYLYGFADGTAPYTYYDQNNDIGSVTGNTFTNFAGGASTAYMVNVNYQNGLTVANCNINGGTGTTGGLYGIYGGTATNANVNIYGNTLTFTTAQTTSYIYAIYNSSMGTGGTTNTLNIYNNTVQNCTAPSATSAYFYGIYNAAAAFNVNFYGNIVNNNVIGGSAYTYTAYTTAGAGVCNVYNNNVTNNQRTGSAASGYWYCLYIGGSAVTSIHDNIVSGNTSNALAGYYIYMYSLYCSNSAISQTVYNNSVHDQSVTTSYSSGYSIYGIYSYPSSTNAATNSVHDNSVYNLTFTCTSSAYSYVYGIASYYANNVYNNTIHDISQNTTTSYGYSYALYCYYGMNCYSNNVYNINETATSGGYGYGYGIYYYASGVGNIYNNKVYGVSMAGASGYYYAMYLSYATSMYVYNNYVSDIKAPVSTSTTGVNGIYIGTPATAGVYYNTVYLNGTNSSTTTFNSAALYASTTPTLDMRNNILVNTFTNTGASTTFFTIAFRRSSTTLTSYATTSNNNDFYAGTPSATNVIYYDGTNSSQTLTAYKSFVSPRDASSITELPPFVNNTVIPYDLHIKTTVATQCESGATIISTPVSITTDWDGNARYPNPGYPIGSSTPSAPDIGADEFGGIILDLTPPNIGFSPLANTSSILARLLTTTITDATGVPNSGAGLPRLYWKINSGSWNNVAGVWVSGNTYTFTLGAGVVLNDVVSYYIVAQDLVATPNVGANPSGGASGFTINPPACSTPPTTPYTYTIVGQMCGNYNVGVGQTYTSLTAAVADLNLKEMTCPVTLTLTDASYSASETFPIVLNNVAGSSAVNTITIKPAAGVTPTISGSSTSGIFVLMGTQYLTINGSNSGGSDQSLTFQQTNTVSNTYCFGIFNNGTVGASNCTIKNCKIMASTQVTNTTYALIFNGAGGGYTNDIIQNNQIYSAYEGMQLAGISGNPASNCQVINNTIGSATDATALDKYGIFIAQADNCLVANNEIMGGPAGNTNYSQAGIYMSTGTTNCKIRANKIHDWFYVTLTGGWGCWGIYYAGDATTVNEISNNLIYNIKSDSYTSGLSVDNLYGVYITSGGNIKFYHNTINMQGNFTSASYTNATACLAINSGVTLMDVQNNIFKNSLQPSAAYTSYTYAIQCGGGSTTFSNLNYNDYWDDGNGPNIGYLNGIQYATFAAWQTATGMEANGINVNPSFVSATDLHPTAVGLQKACPYIALVTNDFSGTLRTNPTDIGGYQVSSGTHSVTTNAATAVLTTTATLNGSITANNLSVLSGFEYGPTTAYGTIVAGLPATVTGNSATGITAPLAGLTPGTLYHFRAKGTSGAVIVNGSDLTFTTLAIPPTVVTTAAGAVTSTTATVNGTVNANGSSTTTSFDYGLTIGYGTNVPGVPLTVTGSTVTGVSAALTGLLPGNTYHYRINGVNLGGTANGNDMTFVTPAAAPTAVTTIASGIGATTATLNGTITANGASTTVTFEYGLTTGYGTIVGGLPSPVTGNTATSVSASLTGLGLVTTYHYRVKGVNSQGTTNGNDMTFTTGCPQAGPAGPITGSPTACQGQCGYVYTVAPIANASGYVWTLPNGGTITAGNNTNSITVCYSPTALSGTVIVFGTATCGNGADSQFPVTINPPAAPTIAGPASVCINSTGNVYTTQTGMTNYQWTVTGGTITGGGGTTNNTVTVTWTSSGAKTVCVNYNSLLGCPAIAPVCYTVTVNPLPSPIITGSGVACTNPGYTYSCQAGMTSYVWTITAGGVITGGNNTNTITVTWNTAGSQNVSANFTNTNGCTAASPTVFPVTVSQTTIPVITGVNSLCVNSGYYFYSTQAGMSSYIWNISAGGVLISGQNTNTIQVQWPQTGAQWVSADFTNAAGCYAPTPTVFNVTVNPAPDPAGGISGTLTVCAGANGVAYSCLPVPNALTYVWTLPPGATIASGSGTNSITVNFAANASSGNILVYGNNLCGNGPASPPFPVTVNALPANAGNVTGPAAVCVGSTGVVYSVLPIANATAYVWTVPAGATINGPSNTSSITVDFGPAAVSGNITVLGTNTCGNGTPSPNFAVTVNPIPQAPIIHPDAVMAGDTLFSSVLTGNQWYFNGNLIPGATGNYYVTDNIGDYTDVIIAGGCSSPPSNSVFAHGVGISEKDATSVNIFPVPNDGLFKLTINCPSKQTFTLHVYNSLGVVIFEQKDIEVRGLTERMVDLRPAPNGVYSVVLTNSDQHIVKKIVINK